jgi:hypothetical protein
VSSHLVLYIGQHTLLGLDRSFSGTKSTFSHHGMSTLLLDHLTVLNKGLAWGNILALPRRTRMLLGSLEGEIESESLVRGLLLCDS